jgi:hypothetical protein
MSLDASCQDFSKAEKADFENGKEQKPEKP